MTNHEEIICPVSGAHGSRDRMVKGLCPTKGQPDPWLCSSCGIDLNLDGRGLRRV